MRRRTRTDLLADKSKQGSTNQRWHVGCRASRLLVTANAASTGPIKLSGAGQSGNIALRDDEQRAYWSQNNLAALDKPKVTVNVTLQSVGNVLVDIRWAVDVVGDGIMDYSGSATLVVSQAP